MDVTDFLPAHCELEAPGRAWASRAMAKTHACWPGDTEFRWPQVATLKVRLAGVGPVEQQSSGVVGLCESFSVWRSGRHGRLDVDARFAAAACSILLGANSVLPMARALSPGERGVFAALIASALDRAQAPMQLAVEVPDAVPLRLDLQVELELRLLPEQGAAVVGWARLLMPSAWLDAGRVYWPRLAGVPFFIVIELARTQLDRTSLGGLKVGDGLVFEGIVSPAAGTDHPMSAWLCVGSNRAPARIVNQELSLLGGLEPFGGGFEGAGSLPIAGTAMAWKGNSLMTSTVEMVAATPAAAPTEAPPSSLAQTLASTPLEVVAEVGRLVLTGAELAGLANGQVLALGGAKGAVTLSVAGRPVGKGVLVNIDGTFGVRVTERF